MIILNGYQVCRNQLKKCRVRQILVITVINYSIYSTFQFTIESKSVMSNVEAALNVFNFGMLFITVINVFINYRVLNQKLRNLALQPTQERGHRIRLIKRHLEDKMRITLSSGILILAYYIFEILIFLVLDFYVSPLEARSKE